MATQSQSIEVAAGGNSSTFPSSFAAWYSVAVLMLMYIFSFIDRTAISLIVEPMKRDLQISDTQIGMLQGLAFALLYTFLGLPIARLSDRHHLAHRPGPAVQSAALASRRPLDGVVRGSL